jgi:hypothetical protein
VAFKGFGGWSSDGQAAVSPHLGITGGLGSLKNKIIPTIIPTAPKKRSTAINHRNARI